MAEKKEIRVTLLGTTGPLWRFKPCEYRWLNYGGDPMLELVLEDCRATIRPGMHGVVIEEPMEEIEG